MGTATDLPETPQGYEPDRVAEEIHITVDEYGDIGHDYARENVYDRLITMGYGNDAAWAIVDAGTVHYLAATGQADR